jgi:hypothetical protein
MTREAHRGKGNYAKNHPNGNREPSKINRTESARQRRQYWKKKAEELAEQEEPNQEPK